MFEQAFKNIDDALRKEAGCTTELDYTEQTSWLLFLKYLDGLERDIRSFLSERTAMTLRASKTAYLLLALLLAGGVAACGENSVDETTRTGVLSVKTPSTLASSDMPTVAPQLAPVRTDVPPTATQPASVLTKTPSPGAAREVELAYAIVDTGQLTFYNSEGSIIAPGPGDPLYGQDAGHDGLQPSYVDNGDGTITDLVTGLMWQQDLRQKATYPEAIDSAGRFDLAGHDDWRLPTIKELYSLVMFSGTDPSGCEGGRNCDAIPFIDTAYFDFEYGDAYEGRRKIDSQFVSATLYVGTTMRADEAVFGVNFADGRIKGYPISLRGQENDFYVRYVRGNHSYGTNDFVDNGDGTITDLATGLMWSIADSQVGLNWGDALSYCDGLDRGGSDNWRLPNAKELQSILDYTRSPSTSGTAAVSPLFEVSSITDESGRTNYPAY